MQDRISIIVPVYNVENYLSKCIDSIVNQTYDNLEIVLVDDGSTDKSKAICDKYAMQDKRIILLHGINQGLSAARNKGICLASGKYIGFVDGDDYIDPEMYDLLYNYLIKYGADIAMCGYRQIDAETNILNEYKSSDCPNVLEKDMIISASQLFEYEEKSINVSVWNKLYKSSLFDRIRFPEGKIYEDIYTTHLLLHEADKLVICPHIKYNYLKRNDSISRKQVSVSIFELFEATTLRYDFISRMYPQYERLARKQYLHMLLHVLVKIASEPQFLAAHNTEFQNICDRIKAKNMYDCDLQPDNIKLIEILCLDTRKFTKMAHLMNKDFWN